MAKVDLEEWMDYFAALNPSFPIFKMWLRDKWEFYGKYLIMDEPDRLSICNKITYNIVEYFKVEEKFVINRRVKTRTTIVKFGNFELSKERIE
jgi:hypothetical protein